MAQLSPRVLNQKTSEKILDLFFQSLLKNKTQKEIKNFLDVLLTPTEKMMLAKRIAVLYLILQGIDHRTISNLLKVSTATVAKFSIILKFENERTKKVLQKIIKERKILKTLDAVGEILFNSLPPPSRNWSEWRKEKVKRQRDRSSPF